MKGGHIFLKGGPGCEGRSGRALPTGGGNTLPERKGEDDYPRSEDHKTGRSFSTPRSSPPLKKGLPQGKGTAPDYLEGGAQRKGEAPHKKDPLREKEVLFSRGGSRLRERKGDREAAKRRPLIAEGSFVSEEKRKDVYSGEETGRRCRSQR